MKEFLQEIKRMVVLLGSVSICGGQRVTWVLVLAFLPCSYQVSVVPWCLHKLADPQILGESLSDSHLNAEYQITWDYICISLDQASCGFWEFELRSTCLYSRLFTYEAISSATQSVDNDCAPFSVVILPTLSVYGIYCFKYMLFPSVFTENLLISKSWS